jgi:hypothetical protein
VVGVSDLDPDRFTQMTFPAQFGEASGLYLIGTFSDGNYRELGQPIENEFSGIWFVDMVEANEVGEEPDIIVNEVYDVGLSLPELPDTGYTYEGWVALDNGDTLSTGKFRFPEFQDYDNSHATPGAIINFPGEDFLVNPPEGVEFPVNLLQGGVAFVTLEPNPDNDLSRPSNFRVLEKNLLEVQLRVRSQSEPMANVAVTTFPRVNAYFVTR